MSTRKLGMTPTDELLADERISQTHKDKLYAAIVKLFLRGQTREQHRAKNAAGYAAHVEKIIQWTNMSIGALDKEQNKIKPQIAELQGKIDAIETEKDALNDVKLRVGQKYNLPVAPGPEQWCEYSPGQSGTQTYIGQVVYYDGKNYRPQIQGFLDMVGRELRNELKKDIEIKLVSIQAMATHIEQYAKHKLRDGMVVQNPMFDKTAAGRCGVGRLVVKINGVKYTLPAVALGRSWPTANDVRQNAALWIAQGVAGASDYQSPVRTALESMCQR